MKVFHHSCFAMGTRLNLVIPNMEKEHGDILADKASLILKEQEEIMSSYREDSEVSKVNRLAGKQKVKLSDELFNILKICNDYYKRTLGAFNPALLGVTSMIKNDSANEQRLNNINAASSGWEYALLDESSATLQFTREKTGLDLGGFGKGWALEKIIDNLKKEGVESAFISFGESTVSAIGEHPLGGPWQTSVPAIDKSNSPLELNLVNESFSISGLKEKSGKIEMIRSPHIFNSVEGSVVKKDTRILVKSKSVLEAEVLSTALLATNNDGITHILDTFDGIEVFECGNEGWIRK